MDYSGRRLVDCLEPFLRVIAIVQLAVVACYASLGCESAKSISSQDEDVPNPLATTHSLEPSSAHGRFQFLNGYRISDLPAEVGIHFVVPPAIGRPGAPAFSHGGPKSKLVDRLVVDEGGSVWRCPALEDRVDCLLMAHVESDTFASLKALRVEAVRGKLIGVSGACDYPCGVVNAEAYVIDPGSSVAFPVVLGTDGEIISRRSGSSAEKLLRWILAIRVETAYVD